MIDEETQKQIDAFLGELRELTQGPNAPSDYSHLYAKYPLVRIGIRRALYHISKSSASSSSFSSSSDSAQPPASLPAQQD
jgi:hypothetical protein